MEMDLLHQLPLLRLWASCYPLGRSPECGPDGGPREVLNGRLDRRHFVCR